MPISPIDIHNKEFNRGFRGYNEDEVNEFLQQLMEDYKNVLDEKMNLENRITSMHEQLGHYNSLEDTLQKSIVVAQEAAEEVRRNSQKEAKLIVKEAEKNADRIVNEALSKARRIAMEIEELKKQSKVFRNRFKMIVEAQLDLIENDDWDHLMEYEADTAELEHLNLPQG
ncbi:septum site-determining protein DivIVA [Kurthia zopfii]|uniref:Cell division initiation protein n=1 Tax=Kurthia zopfii TaxID=1650 RepID=A0A2U3AEG9_9BACL|nr:DivIVA domain-containing protein [Kurthia zopfii]PWI22841.1 septum formation initiator [Kurthia zopfii]TDR40195.1 cell division initiation protein [Kurthia zopfii]STX09005.1 Minicell-associated protein DivIVA [Kurthia zopfii]VEI04781.1 Minicell-associated protein DivIVA [Kurthia zopfii]GEK32089.1 septum site-determining protein DivIVA [Kurthia zopfii]